MNELSTRIDPSRIVNRVVAHHDGDVHELVQILREVQEALDWISPETIDCLVAALGVPRTKIEADAGFYSFFYLVPRGRCFRHIGHDSSNEWHYQFFYRRWLDT